MCSLFIWLSIVQQIWSDYWCCQSINKTWCNEAIIWVEVKFLRKIRSKTLIQIGLSCQSVSWLTSILKWDKYRDIPTSGWNMFLNYLVDIPGVQVNLFQIIQKFLYVCKWAYFLTGTGQTWGYLQFWMKYLSTFFGTFLGW